MRKLTPLLCFLISAATTQAQTSVPAAPAPNGSAPAAGTPAVAATPVPVAIEPPAATPAGGAAAALPAAGPVASPAAPDLSASAPVATPPPVSANPNARTVHEFQGDELAMVLRLLARQAGINIIVSDQVQGTINMRVENLTPLEAIRVIVDAKGLDMSQVNSVYFIKTAAEKAKEPTESGSYTFSYAAAGVPKGDAKEGKVELVENDRLKALIASQIQSGIAPQIDIRTNTVFFRDYKSNIANVMLFLESIDRPTQQVMIEARLVEVNANPKQNYGINWAGTLGGAAAAKTFRYGGSGLTEYTYTNGVISNISKAADVSLNGDLNNILANGTGSDIFSRISNQFAILSVPQFSATLRLMNEDSDTEFLANPRIVTASNLKAQIKITTKQPVPKLKFNEQTASTTFDSFEEKEYGNTLEVTPTINKDNFITMLVRPEISNKVRDESFTIGGTIVNSPVIDTRALESNVLIKSGDTLAIGGLLQDQAVKSRAKVPVLGDVPVLGYLFQEHSNDRQKRNLLVFITPTIIKQGYGTGLEDQVSGLKNSGEEYADPNGWRNNARGAVRMVPTSNRSIAADYPKPGVAPAPVAKKKSVQKFKVTVPEREQ